MAILKLLSEEVLDYSLESMTSGKISAPKQQMGDKFSEVFKLYMEILQEASKVSLVHATLEILYRFLTWIPLGFIIETPLTDLLTNKFLASQESKRHDHDHRHRSAQYQLRRSLRDDEQR